MAKPFSTVLVIVACSGLTCCMGTMESRVEPYDGRFVGWPIYSGLLSDIDVVVDGSPSCKPLIGTTLAVLSFPLDLVLDTALLVPDLFAAAIGWRKGDRCPPATDELSPAGPPNKPQEAADRQAGRRPQRQEALGAHE
jgi:hypothetical protein